jgi:hypothetical protein
MKDKAFIGAFLIAVIKRRQAAWVFLTGWGESTQCQRHNFRAKVRARRTGVSQFL